MRGIFTWALVAALSTTAYGAVQIPISGYDINDAVISGHGLWSHSFSGTITPGAGFVHNTFPGTKATYSGVGSGTLNDGVISTSIGANQLFVAGPTATDGTSFDPTIFLTMPAAYTVETIDLYGGGEFEVNGIPGAFTGVTVTLLKTDFTTISETFVTSEFGPLNGATGVLINDRIDLTGSTLDGVAAYTVILSDFTGTGHIGGWFSITEVELFGDRFVDPGRVPEASTLAIWTLGGLTAAAVYRRRKSRC